MNFKFWQWFKKPEGDLKFLEWFELKKKVDPYADPTDLAVLEEFHRFQKAVQVSRAPMETISRFNIGDGVVVKGEVSNPSFADSPEVLKQKLQHGIHQSVQTGPDTYRISGVGAIAEAVTVVGKIDKSNLYGLGYDIREENAQMVRNLGLETPGTPPAKDVSEEESLKNEHVSFSHYSGKPGERPAEMQPTFPPPEEFLSGTAAAVAPALEEASPLVVAAKVAAFHNLAKNHDPSCAMVDHFMSHIDETTGMEFDCWHICNCKGKHEDDQGTLAPV